MKKGDTFNDDQCLWIVEKATYERNARFQWFTVIAKWTGFGKRPLWATEPRKFVMGRRPI